MSKQDAALAFLKGQLQNEYLGTAGVGASIPPVCPPQSAGGRPGFVSPQQQPVTPQQLGACLPLGFTCVGAFSCIAYTVGGQQGAVAGQPPVAQPQPGTFGGGNCVGIFSCIVGTNGFAPGYPQPAAAQPQPSAFGGGICVGIFSCIVGTNGFAPGYSQPAAAQPEPGTFVGGGICVGIFSCIVGTNRFAQGYPKPQQGSFGGICSGVFSCVTGTGDPSGCVALFSCLSSSSPVASLPPACPVTQPPLCPPGVTQPPLCQPCVAASCVYLFSCIVGTNAG